MANQSPGLLGLKIGMTQLFDEQGQIIPVTVVDVSNNTVLAVKRADGADHYSAIQVGIGRRKPSRTNRPMGGNFKKVGVAPLQHVREIRLDNDKAASFEPGQLIKADEVFTTGELVDITGTSKGHGFKGVMRRYNFRGFLRTHGVHEYFRHGGSIGTRLTPGMVQKGKKMPGQMGNKRVTNQNQRLVRIDAERGLLFIRGGIPGADGGLVLVRKAVKIRKKSSK